MPEHLSKIERSRLMSNVRGKNTAPELLVRSALHALGYRFRIHVRNLPGTPDVVLAKYKLCIFVHGCFWHRHQACKRATIPTNNAEFWIEKFSRTVARDRRTAASLRKAGWSVVAIWECRTVNRVHLERRLRKIMRSIRKGNSLEKEFAA